MASLIRKGFRSNNCFAFDSFVRRVSIKYESRHTARELFPELAECYDDLHRECRAHGGKITLIMGNKAMSSYLAIVKQERLELQRLNENEPCGYSVWLERSQVTSESEGVTDIGTTKENPQNRNKYNAPKLYPH
jgi:hypothetical protein